jgi:hypothetical protein
MYQNSISFQLSLPQHFNYILGSLHVPLCVYSHEFRRSRQVGMWHSAFSWLEDDANGIKKESNLLQRGDNPYVD